MSNGLIIRLFGNNCVSTFISSILSLRYKIVKKYKNIKLLKNGQRSIQYLQKILNEKGIQFFFDMGTLLGIIREGHLLGHDIDIDIGVILTNEKDKGDLCTYLESQKCKLIKKFYVNELGIIEYSFLYNGIKFDVTFYNTVDDNSICHLLYRDPIDKSILKVVKLSCPIIQKIDKYKWNNIEINVPFCPENYLKYRYGDSWKIPDKNYIYWKGPSTQLTDYIGHIERPLE